MKELLFVSFIFLNCIMTVAQNNESLDEDVMPLRNNVHISPFHLVLGTFQLQYEREFGANDNGIVFRPGLTYIIKRRERRSGYSGELQYRLSLYSSAKRNNYIKKESSSNFKLYAGPFIRYGFLDQKYTDYTQEFDSFGQSYIIEITDKKITTGFAVGLITGIRWTFEERISIDIYAGGGWRTSNERQIERSPNNFTYLSNNNGIFSPGYSGFQPRFGFLFGRNF